MAPMTPDLTTPQATRREFLIGTGALIVTVGLAGDPRGAHAQPGAAGAAEAKPVALDQVDSFLAVHKNGRVTVYTGKVDLGTGLRIALPQMVAEELDVRVERITLIEGDTLLTPDQGPTWGSLSIQVAGVQLRQDRSATHNSIVLTQTGGPNHGRTWTLFYDDGPG